MENMRYNKASLESLVSNPNTIFDKEGLLIITERQESLFRKADVNCQRWCKLRGNLLFYLKDEYPTSIPIGVLVLENCRPLIKNSERESDGYVFILEFDGSTSQRIAAQSEAERYSWIKSIKLASFSYLEKQIKFLEHQIALKMGNRLKTDSSSTINNTTHITTKTSVSIKAEQINNVEADLLEIPICESNLCCDNLRCDYNGRKPSTRVICSALFTNDDYMWRDIAWTEIVENSTCPQFLCTIRFYASAGFTPNTILRFTVYDIRELVSATAIPIGFAEVVLEAIQDTTHFRLPLRSIVGDCGFITISSYLPDAEQSPPRSITQVFEQQAKAAHRRSQSLPLKFGARMFVPFHGSVQRILGNPIIHTYRFYSSTGGGDISVQESLLESKLCMALPQQLLAIWISREKELLQEISGMGELGGEWRGRQMELLDKHLKLLNDYSDAKQNLHQLSEEKKDIFYKRSSDKESLDFMPVNLHLQRMCAENNSINYRSVLDIITVGAFTKHSSKGHTGGLIRLLQESIDSPSKYENSNVGKVQAANDVVQTIKTLRKEIVEIMSQLLFLAKYKNSDDMMPLCNEMILKTKTLLNIWDPNLVEEAFTFIEQHRIIEEPDNVLTPLSPFRKITQQLDALDLKSPELEDFASPVTAVPPDLWPRIITPKNCKRLVRSNSLRSAPLKPSVNATQSFQSVSGNDLSTVFSSLPATINNTVVVHYNSKSSADNLSYDINNTNRGSANWITQARKCCNENIVEGIQMDYNAISSQNPRSFLNTHNMSVSPSANYYRPTEEPEPLDLTQLNIEASVMCLVSKIKFLCGRCGSPAIRLRLPKEKVKHPGFSNASTPDVVSNRSDVSNTFKYDSKITSECKFNDSKQDLEHNKRNDESESNMVTQIGLRKGNKFTDGLDLSLTTDWLSELRPSMRKLRHAMDGLLKTARLIHSVQRLQQDMKRNSINLEIMYRRDVCFSQALTTLVTALMAKLWGTEVTENFIKILNDLGILAYFEGLLSLYGGEIDMWGDMCIAIEDLSAVNFTLERSAIHSNETQMAMPRITGSRHSLCVLLPVPDHVYAILPKKKPFTFKVTPVFFNIGINEKAIISRTRDQHRSNWDNYTRLKQYYSRFRKINFITPMSSNMCETHLSALAAVPHLLESIEEQLRKNLEKNVTILHMVEDACRLMSGLRFTSCKSAKDRTGMAVTLEQYRVLVQEFQLPTKNMSIVLDAMRSEGTRMDNVYKNIGKRKYAFNLPQVFSLPAMYRPPTGTYGKGET